MYIVVEEPQSQRAYFVLNKMECILPLLTFVQYTYIQFKMYGCIISERMCLLSTLKTLHTDSYPSRYEGMPL